MAKTYDLGNVKGPKGDQGLQGVSVTNAAVNSEHHLIVTLSSGAQVDAGLVRGEKGETGSQGAQGKSAFIQAQEGGYTGTAQQFAKDLISISKKADKAPAFTVGNLASLGAGGNLADSGKMAADFASMETVTPTLLNGWTYADNSPGYLPKAYRCGNTVTINGVIKGGTTDTWTQLFILPQSMWPKNSRYISTSTGAGHSTYFVNPSNGAVCAILLRKDSTVHMNCSFGLD